MAHQECEEPLLKKVKTEKDELFFTGTKIYCLDQLIPNRSWCGTLCNGYWRDNDQEKEVVIRRIKKTACRENWNNIIDRQIANSLTHKNVLNVYGYEEDINRWRYFALEQFDATLEQYCNREYNGPMPVKAITLCQISNGLNYLHGIGLAHGNVSPSSIMIVKKSESVVIKISDFLYGGSKEEENDDCVLHPKYWMLPQIFSTAGNVQDVSKITSAFTVYGDVFAAGCVFFYFLSRGLHPFGNVKDILANIAKYQPVNLKKLDIDHFAYQSIKDMIGEPPQNGTQYLRIAAAHFKNVPPYNFKEIRRPFSEIDVILVRFHRTLPVLVCCKRNKITVFSASKCSVPFSMWKESDIKFEGKTPTQITSLQWNYDGNLLAAGFENGCVSVWQYATGEIVFKVTQHLEKVIGIYWSPFNYGSLVTRDRTRDQLCLWNAYPRNRQKTLFGTYECGKIIVSVLWTNLQIIVGCRDGTINILNIEETGLLLFLTLKENVSPYGVRGFFPHQDQLRSLFWDEDTKYLASVNKNHSMNIWSLGSYKVIHSSTIDSTWQCLTRRPNKETSDQINVVVARKLMKNFNFACGLENGSIVIWNPFEETKSPPLVIQHHSSPIIRLSFSPDGTFLASACKDEIVIWSTESWIPVFKGGSNDNKRLSWMNVVSNAEPAYKLALSSANSNVIRVIEIADTEIDMWEENKN